MNQRKTIPHYPKYEITQRGEVFRKGKDTPLSWVDNGKGYKSVKLYNSDRPKGRLCLVHRLVMSTWSPEGGEGKDVNHLDGDKANNSLDNLQWVTKSENTRHAHRTGLFASRRKLTEDDVHEIRRRLAEGEVVKVLAGEFSVKDSVVYKIKHRQLHSYI